MAEIQSQGIAVDGSGNIVLADETRARVITGTSGTFYGRKMTAGYITRSRAAARRPRTAPRR